MNSMFITAGLLRPGGMGGICAMDRAFSTALSKAEVPLFLITSMVVVPSGSTVRIILYDLSGSTDVLYSLLTALKTLDS